MALLVPNALSIRTTEGFKVSLSLATGSPGDSVRPASLKLTFSAPPLQYLFVSLRNRESCFQLLCSLSPQLEVSRHWEHCLNAP